MANEKIMNSRQQQKHDLEINWLKATNFIPKEGEIIIYDAEEEGNYEQITRTFYDEDGSESYTEQIRNYWITYPRIKIGNGIDNPEILPFVKDPEEKVGKSVNLNAEIFNDYENNQAFGDYSHTEGQNNLSGIKGYRILDFRIGDEGNWIKLDTESTGSFYEIEDCITIMCDNAKYPNCCIILDNETFTFSTPTDYWHLKVTSFPFETFDLSKNFYLYVQTKPNEGNGFFGIGAHAEGVETRAFEIGSHAEGLITLAAGQYSHAEGDSTQAIGHNTHAEGYSTQAVGNYSHAEGMETVAQGHSAHVEGRKSQASGSYSHAEGFSNRAEAHSAHAEGRDSVASGKQSHAEGYETIASGYSAHTEGSYTKADHDSSHASGFHTTTTNDFQFVCGKYNEEVNPDDKNYLFIVGNGTGDGVGRANGFSIDEDGNGVFSGKVYSKNEELALKSFVEEVQTSLEDFATKDYVQKRYIRAGLAESVTAGSYSTAEGKATKPTGESSHAEGNMSTAEGVSSHAEGHNTLAKLQGSHSEGYGAQATNTAAHAEGRDTQAKGANSHAEGQGTVASGSAAHAEGYSTQAKKQGDHAEGYLTLAEGVGAHAEGESTKAYGGASHVEGYLSQTQTNAYASHAEGKGTIAAGDAQHVQGQYNIEDTGTNTLTSKKKGKYAHILGNGTKDTRSNAHTVDWNGNGWFAGEVKIGGTGQDDTNAKVLATQEYVNNLILITVEDIDAICSANIQYANSEVKF